MLHCRVIWTERESYTHAMPEAAVAWIVHLIRSGVDHFSVLSFVRDGDHVI